MQLRYTLRRLYLCQCCPDRNRNSLMKTTTREYGNFTVPFKITNNVVKYVYLVTRTNSNSTTETSTSCRPYNNRPIGRHSTKRPKCWTLPSHSRRGPPPWRLKIFDFQNGILFCRFILANKIQVTWFTSTRVRHVIRS